MEQTSAARKWITVRDAARYLSCSVSQIRKLIHAGQLKAASIGTGAARKEWRLEISELDRFMTDGTKT